MPLKKGIIYRSAEPQSRCYFYPGNQSLNIIAKRATVLTVEQVLTGQEFKTPFKIGTKIHIGQTIFDL